MFSAFQTGHVSREIFSEILVWEQKEGGDSMFCGRLVEADQFFLNELQK